MIIKNFELKNNIKNNINYYLLYGSNTGLIEETIDRFLKPVFSKNIFVFEEADIIKDLNRFSEIVYNKSFFEEDKFIIINRATDKILSILEEITNDDLSDLKIVIKSNALEKKSKLRNFFEKNKKTIAVAFYEDNNQSLNNLVSNFFREKKIAISKQIINYIIEKTKNNRIVLNNELKKIYLLHYNGKKIELDNIVKVLKSAENYSVSELVDQCLIKNKLKVNLIMNDNYFSSDENIIILKFFLSKLKRLKKIHEIENSTNNFELSINSFRPPIFWKDKEIIKKQLKMWSLDQIIELIKKINNIEIVIKKNTSLSNHLINNFAIEIANFSNN
jgi:DNA polymerase-3 subunit delta